MNESIHCFSHNLTDDAVTENAWSLSLENQAKTTTLTTSIILLLFLLVGLPWNAGVLIKLIKDKFYKEPSSFLLFNLVLVDLLTCLLVMPFQAAPGLAGGRYTLGRSDYQLCVTCYAGVMLIVWLLYISVHLLALMSVDRLLYIVRPLHYDQTVTVPRVAVATVIIWLLCLFISILPLFEFGVISFSQIVGTCSLIVYTESSQAFYYIIVLILEVTIPLAVLFTANIWLIIALCKESKRRLHLTQVSVSSTFSVSHQVNQTAKSKYIQQQLRIVRLFGLIFTSSIVSWIPIIGAIVTVGVIGSTATPSGVYSLIFLCFLSQSVIHPMLESCLIGNTKAIKKLLCQSCCRPKKQDLIQSSNATSFLNDIDTSAKQN